MPLDDGRAFALSFSKGPFNAAWNFWRDLMRRTALAILAATLLLLGISFSQVQLPKTPVRAVTDDYFGTKVTDPYRWLENTSDPEVVAWMKAQNDYTRAALSRIPGREKLLDRIKQLDNAGPVVSGLQVWGGHYFYLKTEPGSDNRRLYVRDTVSAPERLLMDPGKADDSRRQALLD